MDDLESFLEGSLNGVLANPIADFGASSLPIASAPQAAAPATAEKKAQPVASGAAKPKPAVREPSMKKMGKTMEFSDYKKLDAPIEIGGADVDNSSVFNFWNCERIKIKITGKFKAFMFQSCKRVDFYMDDCIAIGEVCKCHDMKIYVKNKCPLISAELSNGVQVITTLESKHVTQLRTTASQSVSFEYPREPGTFDPNNEDEQW